MSALFPSVARRAAMQAMLDTLLPHLQHVLPAQAPIRDFVHHNTLHGLQHLPFHAALAEAQALTGAAVYWPESRFRAAFAAGRIETADLAAAVEESFGQDCDVLPGLALHAVLQASLLQPWEPVSGEAVAWQQRQLSTPDAALRAVCQQVIEQGWWTPAPVLAEDWRQEALAAWDGLAHRVGHRWTWRALLEHLTGEDVLAQVRPALQAHLAAHLDQGMSAWRNPQQASGFYAAWRASAGQDAGWDIDALPHVREDLLELPTDAVGALAEVLPRLLPDDADWPAYLERLALELPGWSGMFLRRSALPPWEGVPVNMVDYLAVRVVLESLLVQDLLNRLVGAPLTLDELGGYFACRPGELYVRHTRHQGGWSEAVWDELQALLAAASDGRELPDAPWAALAERMFAEHCAQAQALPGRLAQLHALLVALNLSAAQVAAWDAGDWKALYGAARQAWGEDDTAARLRRGQVWLLAYERHYREAIFAAVLANHGRSLEPAQAQAQVVMCMDDREEGTRRHLEEIAPQVQTFGAAGFFGLPMAWQGLDDQTPLALCPVVVRPAHLLREIPADPAAPLAVRQQRRRWRLAWRARLVQGTRREALAGSLLSAVAAPLALATLTAALAWPAAVGRRLASWRTRFDQPVATQIAVTAAPDSPPGSPEQLRAGFDDAEQAALVGDFLRSIGLTGPFAPLVLILGHGSESRNNPHRSAYDCGACSGRHGGPNARVFAALANRPEVRRRLAAEGLSIPEHCLFVAAFHNTCDDGLQWYDVDQVPEDWQAAHQQLVGQLEAACRAHAVERCRRLASAPRQPSLAVAWQHVADRLHDISQARPELGHATNAMALVGRRAFSRGLFLDRRAFLISYDPAADAEGAVAEQLLLAVAPVGAGINLEYYFSTVDNQYFGCASKVTHNLTGLFGIMDGTASDLRTGLPQQMVEIHEPMRLLVIIEQTPEVLSAIVGRQPRLAELVVNEWIIVAAKTPDEPVLHRFCPRRGWLPWQADAAAQGGVGRAAASQDWFGGASEALPPAILGVSDAA